MKTNNTYNQSEFNFSGSELRDIGIEMSVSHAESEISNWKEITWKLFAEFLREQREPFMGETFRAWAEAKGVVQPPSLRAYGHILMRAAREKLIERIGYKKVDNPKCHCTPASLWMKI